MKKHRELDVTRAGMRKGVSFFSAASLRLCVNYSCCIGIGILLLLGTPGVVQGEEKPDALPAPVAKDSPKTASGVELPTVSPIDRYQLMLDKPLFAVATQAAPPPPPPVETAAFSKDLVLTGVARMASGEYVSIVSRDQTQRFGLMTGDSYNGITVANVTWSDTVGKTKVTLKQGNEYGVIAFDEVNLTAGAGGSLPPGATPPNGQPQPAPGGGARPPVATGPGSAPANRTSPPAMRRRTIIPTPPPQ